MMLTRGQQAAQKAFAAVKQRLDTHEGDGDPAKGYLSKYLSFARAFPTLIHTSGLAQATAFALAKGEEKGDVLGDLALVLGRGEAKGADFVAEARGEPGPAADLAGYIHLSREALSAASWLKRYAEALLTGEEA
jgi:CRISPR-associated protein Cmr5